MNFPGEIMLSQKAAARLKAATVRAVKKACEHCRYSAQIKLIRLQKENENLKKEIARKDKIIDIEREFRGAHE